MFKDRAHQDLHFEAPAMELSDLIADSRRRTLELVQDFSDTQWVGPYLPTVNPPAWELCHIASFYEALKIQSQQAEPVAVKR